MSQAFVGWHGDAGEARTLPLQWMASLMLGWLIGSWVLRVPFSGAGAASAALMGFRHTLFIIGPVRVPGEAAGIN